MENLNYYNSLRSVPEKYTKKITGGRLNGMTDIKPQWRTEKMTEVFGPCGIGWYYEETKREYKEYKSREEFENRSGEKRTEDVTHVAVFIDINLYFRYEKIDTLTGRVVGYEWSKPIHGTGGSMFVAKEKSGMFVSDEAIKMALTDALSVAMKAIGMAADIYMGMPATGTKYDKPAEQPAPKQYEPKKDFLDQSHIRYAELIDKLKNGGTDKLGNRLTAQMICDGYNVSPKAKKAFESAENEFLNKTK